jgi:hypothetical protein
MRARLAPEGKVGRACCALMLGRSRGSGACNCLPVTDLCFRSLFAFFLLELKSRKVIHVGGTRFPPDAWTAQQRREATAYGQRPNDLLRDCENTCGPHFACVAATFGNKMLTTPSLAPRAKAIGERFVGSVRRECLDHCSSYRRSNSIGCFMRLFSTSTKPGRIKASSSRFRSSKRGQCHHLMKVARSSPCRFWAGCIVTIAEVPEFFLR